VEYNRNELGLLRGRGIIAAPFRRNQFHGVSFFPPTAGRPSFLVVNFGQPGQSLVDARLPFFNRPIDGFFSFYRQDVGRPNSSKSIVPSYLGDTAGLFFPHLNCIFRATGVQILFFFSTRRGREKFFFFPSKAAGGKSVFSETRAPPTPFSLFRGRFPPSYYEVNPVLKKDRSFSRSIALLSFFAGLPLTGRPAKCGFFSSIGHGTGSTFFSSPQRRLFGI